MSEQMIIIVVEYHGDGTSVKQFGPDGSLKEEFYAFDAETALGKLGARLDDEDGR